MTRKDALRLLDLLDTATAAEIKKKAKALKATCHPDVTGKATAALFRAVQEAEDVLTGKQRADEPPASRVVEKVIEKIVYVPAPTPEPEPPEFRMPDGYRLVEDESLYPETPLRVAYDLSDLRRYGITTHPNGSTLYGGGFILFSVNLKDPKERAWYSRVQAAGVPQKR